MSRTVFSTVASASNKGVFERLELTLAFKHNEGVAVTTFLGDCCFLISKFCGDRLIEMAPATVILSQN